MRFAVYPVLLCLFSFGALAQTSVVTGVAVDSATGSALSGATASIKGADGKVIAGAVCDSRGRFTIHGLEAGARTLLIHSFAYNDVTRKITIPDKDTLKLGTIRVSASALLLEGVEVEAMQIRGEQKGDTTEFNAKAFKTDKNASADDLVRKMPGVEIENGQVKAQGEQVRRVLVDGKPFFGDDPAATLKALPSDIIDKVQVYDQASDQSQFTRFDDGDRSKTLNVVTKTDKRVGQFGKLYAGYGTDSHYNTGATINFFDGDRRFSILAMSNNVNEQNFSMQDILGAMGGGGNQFMKMAGRNMAMFSTSGGGRSSMNQRGFGGGGGGGGFNDFTVSPSDGISKSSGLGLNYSDQWAKNLSVSGSYFFNRTNTDQQQYTNREYVLSETGTQLNTKDDTTNTINTNHRANFRLDYGIDSMSSILITPRFTWQGNDKVNSSLSRTVINDTARFANTSQTLTTSDNTAYNFSTDLLYRLRFATEGRTLSANINTTLRSNDGSSDNSSQNYFGIDTVVNYSIDQLVPSNGSSKTVGGNITYTEPLATQHQLQLSYNVNNSHNVSDRRTYDVLRGDAIDTALSSVASSNYLTHRPGISYRFSILPPPDTGKAKPDAMMMMMGGDRAMGSRMMGMMGGAVGTWTFGIGADYQHATLDVDQSFPSSFNTSRTYNSILPNISIVARPSFSSNIRLNYRTYSNAPQISQLQDAVDNSDPLRWTRGNSGLKQELTHSIFANYGTFNMISASGLFAMVYAQFTQDKIVNSTHTYGFIPGVPSTVRTGVQLTEPVNRDGYANVSSFCFYSYPVEPFKGLKLNMSTNAGVVYTRDISLIDSAENISSTWVMTPSIGMSSNISEYTDFSLSARSAYTTFKNSLQSELDAKFFTHTIIARGTFITHDSSAVLDGWVFTGDLNYIITSGLAEGFNKSVPLLNLAVGKRFLDGRGELKLSVFDLLNKNNAISRNTYSGYVEDSRTTVLQQYFLLTFTYNLRLFK